MVPTSAGRDHRRFPDRLSSVREVMSHRDRGNSDRALLDRLRLLSLQNLEKVRDIERETEVEGRDEESRQSERQKYNCQYYNQTFTETNTVRTF